ncbi:coiled-coil domain-containing protein 39-like [Paramacrobiotus metropolitanus]|uniref:coiled-coil domain-containing protein 39-like n=1 Tax=Paramacrobiotus metropolitanus TaxID=2943436 RepID=UPI002445C842|nr:coiled-coil domain-containing protein 39-like [Paramacrobiotus metropolitanus]
MEESQLADPSATMSVLRTLKLALATREQELFIAKAKADRFAIENQQLSVANSDLQNHFVDLEHRIVENTSTHFRNSKNLEENLVNLQEELWTEREKNGILVKQLDSQKVRAENSYREVSKGKLTNEKLLHHLADQHNLRESVLSGFQENVQQLTRYCGQLENEALDNEQTRQTIEKLYADKMDSLQSTNEKLSADLRLKVSKVDELAKELDFHKRYFERLSENPTEQFKLISELYAALVAAENKTADLEQRDHDVTEYRNQAEKSMNESNDESFRLRNALQESEDALRKTRKELFALKEISAGQSTPVVEISDSVANAREIELHQLQDTDSEKSRFFSLLAANSELFDKCIALASNENVLWAFLSDHDKGQYQRERKELKSQLKAALAEAVFLRTQVERLQTDHAAMESFSNPDHSATDSNLVSDLKAKNDQLKQVEENLRVARFEVQKWSGLCDVNKQMLQAKNKQCDELVERERKRLDEVVAEKKITNDLRMENKTLTERIAEIQAAHNHCSEQLATESELNGRIVQLKAEVESLKFRSEQLRAQPQFTTEVAALRAELSDNKQRNSELRDKNKSLTENRSQLLEKVTAQQKTITELEQKYQNELHSHETVYEDVGELRKDVDLLKASLSEADKRASSLQAALNEAELLHQRKTEALQSELQYLTEERKNSDTWREIVWEGLRNSAERSDSADIIDTDIIVKHLKTENDLLKKQLNLAKDEYLTLTLRIGSAHTASSPWHHQSDTVSGRNVETIAWEQKYREKKERLSIAIENSGYLRRQLAETQANSEQLNRKLEEFEAIISSLQENVQQLEREKISQMEQNKNLQQQLDASNKRFDNDQQRHEIAKLKQEKAAADRKYRQDLERINSENVSQNQKRLEEIRTMNNEVLKSKDTEVQNLKEALRKTQETHGKQVKDLEAQCNQMKVNMELEKQDLSKRVEIAEKQLAAANRTKSQATERYNQETSQLKDQLAQSHKELTEALEKVQRFESPATLSTRPLMPVIRPNPSQPPSETGVSQGGSGLPRKPVAQTSPMPSSLKSTAVVIPHSHPINTIHRVMPQIRLPDSIPFLAVNPQAVESGISPQPGPSSASTSMVHLLVFTTSRLRPAAYWKEACRALPWENQITVSALKRARESEQGSPEQKRRRDTSPTSSDVTSSTNTARNSLGQVGSASLLRARANSRSALSSPTLHLELSGEKRLERVSGAVEEPLVLAVPAQDLQESSVEESSFVSDSDTLRDRSAAGSIQVDRADTDAFTDYDTDDSQDVQPSSDVRRSVSIRLPGSSGHVELPDDAPDLMVSRPENTAATSREFGCLVGSSIADIDEPGTSSLAGRSMAPELPTLMRPSVVIHTNPFLAPPRTPGAFSSAYDVGDEASYGVVPSTPKILIPHRGDENSMMPQVPSLFFGPSEAIEDVTASQVPPTPYQPDIEFFGQNSENASEDSESSFPADDDVPGPVPSTSRGRSAALNARLEEVEIADDAQPADIDGGFAENFPESPGPMSVEPAVPSPGSIDSVEAVDMDINDPPTLSALPVRLSPTRRILRPRRSQPSGRIRSASPGSISPGISIASSSGILGSSRQRQPVIAPSAVSSARGIAATRGSGSAVAGGRLSLLATRPTRAARGRGRARRARTGHQ